MNADALETVCGSNGSEADDGSCEDIETRLRDMREVVDEIERNYSLVGAQSGSLSSVKEHLRHRLDAGCVHFVEAVHVTQDAVQIGLELCDFLLREGQVGQPGDITNFLFGDFHARAFFRESL